MLISCSFNSFRIFGHYISARFQIIWRPNLWLVSCTALIFFLEFIILQISLSFFLYCCHLPLHHTIITIIKRAPDLSSPAFPSFHLFMLLFLHGYVLPPSYHLPGLYCHRLILLEIVFILSLLSG